MNHLKFSIVTISFNAIDYIENTIRSVIDQNYSNIEYILIDGGSTDGTKEKIEKLLPEIKKKCVSYYFVSERDKGISDAFNKGIKKATGDIIGLINSGDGLLPGALECLNKEFSDNDDILYGKTLAIDDKYHLKYLRKIPNNLDLSKMVYNGMIFTHQSAFVRKSVYEKFGLYDISYKYIMDTDLFIHFYNHGVQFRYVDALLVSMLCGGISARATKDSVRERIRLSQKYGGYSSTTLWLNYYKSLLPSYIKDLARKSPKLWYRLIGEERRYK